MSDEKVSKAELARLLGISKARVSQLIKCGLPIEADGRVKREIALNWISHNTSQKTHRENSTYSKAMRVRTPKAENPLAFADAIADPLQRGMVMGAVQMAYDAGAIAALGAFEAGAPLRLAYQISIQVRTSMFERGADWLAKQGCEPFATNPDFPFILEDAGFGVDWPRLASERGETFHPEAWRSEVSATAQARLSAG